MAGSNRFKKKHHKEAQDTKTNSKSSKAAMAAYLAAKDEDMKVRLNAKMQAAMETAQEPDVPKSYTESSRKRKTEKYAAKFQESMYEGFAPSKISVIVETVTDNIARTYHTIRTYFNKNGGSLTASGCVSYMFKHVGIITYPGDVKKENEMSDLALKVGADDCKLVDGEYVIHVDFGDFDTAKDQLEKSLGEPTDARVIWKPDSTVVLDHPQTKKVLDFIKGVEDEPDVQNVFSNLEIPEKM